MMMVTENADCAPGPVAAAGGDGGRDEGAALSGLATALDYRFGNPALLADALTHPSLLGLGRGSERLAAHRAYERLEFLGDRVLGLVVAEWLYDRFPTENEGQLAKRHAALVQGDALCRVAEELDLGRYIRMSTGERDSGGRSKRTLLADCCEAVIGALYLDGGLEPARGFIRARWAGVIERSTAPQDVKTMLQEWVQGQGRKLPRYEVIDRSGPAHAPEFQVRLVVEGEEPEIARGSSKREAEKAAAQAMLDRLGVTGNE
ncbi:MAG: ribonuclease III [Azospirillaceae bacterium]|nr:ribonuclease III [Azospirillaceae bacterium]